MYWWFCLFNTNSQHRALLGASYPEGKYICVRTLTTIIRRKTIQFIQLSLTKCGRKLRELINCIQSNQGWISNLKGECNALLLRSESSALSAALRDFHLPKHYRHLLFKPFAFKEPIKEILAPESKDSRCLFSLPAAQGEACDTVGFWEIGMMLPPRVLSVLLKGEVMGMGTEPGPCLQE